MKWMLGAMVACTPAVQVLMARIAAIVVQSIAREHVREAPGRASHGRGGEPGEVGTRVKDMP